MLSRVANNLFWLERYIERSNGLLNLLKANYLSDQDFRNPKSWGKMLTTYCDIPQQKLLIEGSAMEILKYMILDLNNPNTVINLIEKSRENARSVQGHISTEMWLNINKYFLAITKKNIQSRFQKEDPILLIDEILNYHMIHLSTSDVTQERGNAYCFMNIGKYLERLFQSTEFLLSRKLSSVKSIDALEENIYWKYLLISIGGYQQYIKTHKSVFLTEKIMEMIILNPHFPRSIYYCTQKLSLHISRLSTFNKIKSTNDLSFLVGKLESSLFYTKVENLNSMGPNIFLTTLKSDLMLISEQIDSQYFHYINPTHA